MRIGTLVMAARKGLAFALVVTALGGVALAKGSAPEIDPGAVGPALTLLVGGALLLKDRFTRK